MAFNTDNHKDVIIEAAYSVFSTNGYEMARVSEIATLCQTSTATIYKIFGSKLTLFHAAFDFGVNKLRAGLDSESDEGSLEQRLTSLTRRLAALGNMPEAQRLIRMQILRAQTPGSSVRQSGLRLHGILTEVLMPILVQCAAVGKLDAYKLDEAFALLVGFIGLQTLGYGLTVSEGETPEFTGDALADAAVAAMFRAYSPIQGN